MAPIWIAQIFTQYKSFRDNPLLGSRLLNRMGLHVARVIAANAVGNLRRFFLIPFVPSEYRRRYRRDGYLQIDDFLPEDEFKALKSEVLHVGGEMREMTQGNTLTQMLLMDGERREELPHCARFLESGRFIRLLSYVCSNYGHPVSFIHCVKNGFVEKGGADPQKTLHSDTFQPTAKYWLFLNDVAIDEGPFVYAPGSHALTGKRLKFEYDMSCRDIGTLDHHSAVGSFRISERELTALGFAPKPLPVRANTLVIANTHGFHRRGDIAKPCSRLAIFGSARVLPFNPLPGFGSRTLLSLQHFGLKKIWSAADRRAAERGMQPQYRRVPASKLRLDP